MAGLLLLFLFGAVIGVASGLFGIGGGILLVPGLMILFGFSQQQAQGTSLAVMVPPIGIFAAAVYYRHGYIDIPVVGWVAVGFAVGAFLGAHLIALVPVPMLRVVFGSLLLYLGFTFVLNPTHAPTTAALPSGLAALVATTITRLLRRGAGNKQARPAEEGDDFDFHI